MSWFINLLAPPIVLKSGSLNLLEPLVPIQACNGIALPLPLPLPDYGARRYMQRLIGQQISCKITLIHILVSW
jgi:hypothetical protein